MGGSYDSLFSTTFFIRNRCPISGWLLGRIYRENVIFQFLCGIALPLLIIGLWSIFGAPKTMMPLNSFMHALVEIALFTLAVLALYNTGKTSLAITFALMVLFNQMLSFLLKTS
ncbi:YrdB family protein [Lysinibacillus sp. FSL H8-0500]|uniref:YrdB family protein n=1 Tax=Lysinibacillus sp. FSL H8-0500 TaxID=2921393 RepID=UPI0031011904